MTRAASRIASGVALGAALAAASAAATAGAQEPARPAWQARATVARETFASDEPQWTPWVSYGAAAARRFASGSLALELSRTRRFGTWEGAAAVDAYRTLWRRAYGNVRVQLAPGADALPRHDVSAELFQGLAGGWEPSVAVRRMAFASETVDFAAASLGRFVGPWYARGRATWVPRRGGADAGSVSALARRYLGGATDAYLEASAGSGGEAVTLAPATAGAGPVVEVRRTTFVSVGAQWHLGAHLGASASASVNTFAGVPTRRGGSVGAVVRW